MHESIDNDLPDDICSHCGGYCDNRLTDICSVCADQGFVDPDYAAQRLEDEKEW